MTSQGRKRNFKWVLHHGWLSCLLLAFAALPGCQRPGVRDPYAPLPTDPGISGRPDETVAPGERLYPPDHAPDVPTRWYVIRQGDTLWSISQRFGIRDWSDILDLNPGLDAQSLHVGQRIRIPIGEFDEGNPSADPQRAAPDAGPQSRRPPLNPNPQVRTGVAERTFAWPARGKVVCRFGQEAPWAPKVISRGIVVSVQPDTRVQAAKSGIAFVMRSMPGLGQTVAVDHGDGTVTTYGYNREILVRHGEFVSQGDALAIAGSYGNGRGSQVYFRIDRADGPVDPLSLLPR